MSDGNFNRNLLPYNNYQSGLRAGIARTRTKALEQLQEILKQHLNNTLTDEKAKAIIAELHQRLTTER